MNAPSNKNSQIAVWGRCSGDVQKQHLQVSDPHDQNSAHDSPGRLVQIYPQKQKKPALKPLKLYQMPLGTRVCIDTKRFDGDTPGSYSKGKPAKLFGTLVKKGKAGVMYVDYDIGGISKSHWTHLTPVGVNEKKQVHTV